MFDRFDKKDIAQMLTSIFVIFQVYLYPITPPPFISDVVLFFTSLVVCFIVLKITAEKDVYKHLIAGLIISTVLSVLIGVTLLKSVGIMLIAIAIGLPAASMIDSLKD